jgi:hypothetical protein
VRSSPCRKGDVTLLLVRWIRREGGDEVEEDSR